MLLTGRGGEGVVLASQLLADTFARAGFWVQAFPEFKAERRGAPISAFLRWDEEPIRRRYKVRECDVLVGMTPSPPTPQALGAVRPGGLVVLNRETRYPHAGDCRIAYVPASRIARERGVLSAEGRAMGNVAVLGACVRLLLPDGLPHLEQAIRARMGVLADRNVLAAREGFERATVQHHAAHDTPLETARAAVVERVWPEFCISGGSSLAIRTGSWSLERPVLLEACSACAVCALFCPESAMHRVDGHMEIDLAHCKGCGICQVVCPVRNAIAMEEVPA
jgi:2-oxoacid:acceptor oxidoreductase gamma subunit (pyruvate/2-ketoisovalerate family)/2-oxoacid:acceptor oxidoreductase delta subunit (pyruvate/2-ketoisovalerate family)